MSRRIIREGDIYQAEPWDDVELEQVEPAEEPPDIDRRSREHDGGYQLWRREHDLPEDE